MAPKQAPTTTTEAQAASRPRTRPRKTTTTSKPAATTRITKPSSKQPPAKRGPKPRATRAHHLLNAIYTTTISPSIRTLSRTTHLSSTLTYGEVTPSFVDTLLRDFAIGKMSSLVDLGSGVGNVVLQAYLATGCRALGCEIDGARHAAASRFRDAVAGVLQPATVPTPRGGVRTNDMGTGRELQDAVVLRRGDVFEDWVTLARVQSADLVFSDNLKFGPELVGRQVDSVLARMKPGAVFVSLEKVVRGRGCARVLAALGVTEERRVSERGAVSWADKEIEYWVYRK